MIDVIGLLLVIIVILYIFGKLLLYYKLLNSELQFSWQNQFHPWYRGQLFGYILAMVIITYWPLMTEIIKSSYKIKR